MPTAPSRPSDAVAPERWAVAHDRLVDALRSLIRIPSINPPDPPGAELAAARWIAGALEVVGIPAAVHELVPGRGSVTARLRGDGTGGEPLLLMSHLDVVPAPPAGWTHDPFGGDIADGWVYGRGAVDMKDLLAMQLEVLRLLAEETRAAGRDPASDPVPGLRRDLLFASVADEEAGGLNGAALLALEHPDTLRAAAAINEAGGVAVDLGSRRLYPIQVAEKGISVFQLTFNGIWGHGSMPRAENANVLAAEAVSRLTAPWPARLTDVTKAMLERTIAELDGADGVPPEVLRLLRAAASGDSRVSAKALEGVCLPVYTRVLDAMLRDTLSPNVLHGGVKFNVIPGTATLELDVRRLPGTSEDDMVARIRERLGPELSAVTDIEALISSEPLVHPYEDSGGLFPILEAVIRDHDPHGIPVPAMAPFGTDAKHLRDLGVPTFGFSPLRQPPGETYIERWHGIDERVSIDGLRWGLPVLYDAVRRFCA
ncbi:MAG TPA: M20/M25/M40 family metallo-hydrolase [Candidatus Limnocylindrales bacterium]|nr:M20/M25/M40 family metallo-hydrolase [Candidatus Limnocylindrales bacterium]